MVSVGSMTLIPLPYKNHIGSVMASVGSMNSHSSTLQQPHR